MRRREFIGLASIDAIGAGLVASLAHPGGNITGLSHAADELVGKALELLRMMLPHAARVAILVNANSPSPITLTLNREQAAHTLGVELVRLEVRVPADLDRTLASIESYGVDALIVPGDTIYGLEPRQIIRLVEGRKLPTLYYNRDFVVAGGLMSYSADIKESFRKAASFVDRILKGAKPADLPVEQPTRFELVINLETARALGLLVPRSLLARVDELIE